MHENSSQNLLSDRESPVSGGNQYEVPYCHSHHPGQQDSQRFSSQPGYSYRHYPYFHYLNDYDSY